MDTVEYIAKKYNLDTSHVPVEIPNMGRNDLAVLFNELGYTNGVEIGTEQGFYAEVLCQSNPNLELTCIDPWINYPGYREYVSQEKIDKIYSEAKERLAPYNCKLIRAKSIEALRYFKDESLDFVYIDGNHEFSYITEDIVEWSKKVRTGGIVAGHDYMIHKEEKDRVPCHVVWVVGAFTGAFKIRPWFVVGSKNNVPGEVRDSPRSWFYVKK